MIKDIIKSFLKLIFVKKKIIIFESNPDFSDNTYWLFRYMVETKLFVDYRFVWFIYDYSKRIDNLCGVPIICVDNFGLGLLKKIRRNYYENSAEIIIDCNRCIQKQRSDQTRIYLGHGMPIKTVEEYVKKIGDVDFLPLAGEGFRDFYKKFGYEKAINVCGLPRNEAFTKYKEDKKKKYIIWMPTFRQHKLTGVSINNNFPIGVPAIKSIDELKLVDDYLGKKNIQLYLRPHPVQDISVMQVSDMRNIVIADDRFLEKQGLVLYEFLAKSSALITDYSSVYYDYLLADRPIGLTLEDAEDFAKQWGLFFSDIRNELPGVMINNVETMIEFIEQIYCNLDVFFEDRRRFCLKYGIKRFDTSKKITDWIVNIKE